jgi:hypothetical protein
VSAVEESCDERLVDADRLPRELTSRSRRTSWTIVLHQITVAPCGGLVIGGMPSVVTADHGCLRDTARLRCAYDTASGDASV